MNIVEVLELNSLLIGQERLRHEQKCIEDNCRSILVCGV